MKRLALVAVLLLAACSSSDSDTPQTDPMPRRGRMGGGGMMSDDDAGGTSGRMGGSLIGLLPPAHWWRDPQISEPVRLTPEQMTALDKIGSEQGEEVLRMERDSAVAIRDLRTTLDGAQSTQDEIVAAGQRLRALRDDLFGRELLLLAAERGVLSQQQWRALQDTIAAMRRPNRGNDNMGGGRRGGMGGRGGHHGGFGGM